MQVVADEAAKILHRCDKNSDGKIGEEEFEAYYLQTAEVRRHKGGGRERQRGRSGWQ